MWENRPLSLFGIQGHKNSEAVCILFQGLERWTASKETVTALGENENEVSSTQRTKEKKEAAVE